MEIEDWRWEIEDWRLKKKIGREMLPSFSVRVGFVMRGLDISLEEIV